MTEPRADPPPVVPHWRGTCGCGFIATARTRDAARDAQQDHLTYRRQQDRREVAAIVAGQEASQ